MSSPYPLSEIMFHHLRQSEIERVERIGQRLANKRGAVIMSDVILEIFLKGLDAMEAEE